MFFGGNILKKIILAAHGNFAVAAKGTLEMIMGPQESIEAITFSVEEGLNTVVEKMQTIIEQDEKSEWLIIADLYGGTPFNAGSSLAMMKPEKKIKVISGLSLPILLEMATGLNSKTLDELVFIAIETSKQIVKEFSKPEEEEDLL